MSKGSKRRPTNTDRFSAGWDRAFGKAESSDLSASYWDTYGHLDFTLSAEEVIEGGDFTIDEAKQLVSEGIIEWDSSESSHKYR